VTARRRPGRLVVASCVMLSTLALSPQPAVAAPAPAPAPEVTAATVKAAYTKTEQAAEAMNAAHATADATRTHMAELASSITALQVQYSSERDMVAQSVVDQQMSNPLGATTQLLASQNPTDFIDGLHAERLVAEAQTQRLDDLLDSGEVLEQQKQRLADKQALLDAAEAEAARHLREAKTAHRAAKAALAKLDAAQQLTFTAPSTAPAPGSVKVHAAGDAKTVLKFALAQLGDPYVWGGNGPDGWDCSGLIQQAFAAAGVAVPRVVGPQYDASTHIDMRDLRPGDVVFYADMSHIGLYVGDGTVVHAPRPGRNVEFTGLNGFSKAGRYLK
jgi:cell wall-associated NlpC family hydrolase